MIYDIEIDGTSHRVELFVEDRKLRCRLDGEIVDSDICLPQAGAVSLLIDGRPYEIRIERIAGRDRVVVSRANESARFDYVILDPRALRRQRGARAGSEGPQEIKAPMPGRVVRILAPPGTEVEQGQGVIVIEAMKMQNELKSPKKGKVSSVRATEGAAVNPGDTLAVVD